MPDAGPATLSCAGRRVHSLFSFLVGVSSFSPWLLFSFGTGGTCAVAAWAATRKSRTPSRKSGKCARQVRRGRAGRWPSCRCWGSIRRWARVHSCAFHPPPLSATSASASAKSVPSISRGAKSRRFTEEEPAVDARAAFASCRCSCSARRRRVRCAGTVPQRDALGPVVARRAALRSSVYRLLV